MKLGPMRFRFVRLDEPEAVRWRVRAGRLPQDASPVAGVLTPWFYAYWRWLA